MCYTFVDIFVTTTQDPVPDVMPPTKSKRKRQSFQGEAITEDEPGSKIIRKSANHSEDTTEREKEPSVNLVEAKKRKRTRKLINAFDSCLRRSIFIYDTGIGGISN